MNRNEAHSKLTNEIEGPSSSLLTAGHLEILLFGGINARKQIVKIDELSCVRKFDQR